MKYLLDLRSKHLEFCQECGAIKNNKLAAKQEHKHSFGEGYYSIVDGSRTLHTQICKDCGYVNVVDLTKQPKENKPSLLIKGMTT